MSFFSLDAPIASIFEKTPTGSSERTQGLKTIASLICVCVSAFQILSILFGWFKAGDLATFLNNWESLQSQFIRTFPAQYRNQNQNPKLYKTRSSLFLIPLSLSRMTRFDLFLMVYVIFPGAFSIPVFLAFPRSATKYYEVVVTVSCGLLCYFQVVELLEDTKVILILKSLANAFEKVHITHLY